MGVKRASRHITRGPRWHAIRQRVLARDGYKCRHCGRAARLEIDHIKPVRTHPELAYEPTNLQSLCTSCHTLKTNAERGNAQTEERAAWFRLLKEGLNDAGKRKDSKAAI